MKKMIGLLRTALLTVADKVRFRDVVRFVVGVLEGETGKTLSAKVDRDSAAYTHGHFLGTNAPGTVVAFVLGVVLAGGACLFVL